MTTPVTPNAAAPIRFTVAPCALGQILVAQSQCGVCAIFLGDTADALRQNLRRRFPQLGLQAIECGTGTGTDTDARLAQTVAHLQTWLAQPDAPLQLTLDLRGTTFQQRVWQALCDIPPGTTASYTDIAQRLHAPKAVRAVAQACAANPLALAVPCHRVIGRDGGLSGYRWGLERKRALLARERAVMHAEIRHP